MTSDKEANRQGRKATLAAVRGRFIPSHAGVVPTRSGNGVIRCSQSLGLKVRNREGYIHTQDSRRARCEDSGTLLSCHRIARS